MRIIQINMYQVKIPFRFSFKHAGAQRKFAENIIVEVKTEKGATGFGEAIPREYLTGETLDSIWDDIAEYWVHRIMDIEFSFSQPLHQQLLPLYKEASKLRKLASYGALDIAIHAAASYTRGESIAELIGCPLQSPYLTAPLGGKSLESIKKLSKLFKALRFREFKIKTGMGKDEKKVALARKLLGERADIRVDSNRAWSLEEALELIPQLQNYGVNTFEEPVNNINEMAFLKRTLDVDIMADESLCSYEDALKLVELDAASTWNLRLGKNGGFTGIIELIKLAEANNIKPSLGVLVGETSVLSEASLAITGLTDFSHVEYGFNKILLKSDPFINATPGYFGRPRVNPARSGLGLVMLRKKIKRCKKRETTLNNGVYSPPKHQRKSFISDLSFFRK